MMRGPWCAAHLQRLHDAKDARFVVETLIVNQVLEAGKYSTLHACWACALSEIEFQAALREGGSMVAQAEAYGGTYTANGIALSLGRKQGDES